MKSIEKIIEPLNLIYYEYDKKLNILKVDKNWLKEHIYKEFIKITYTLSKYNVSFFVDSKQSIVLNKKYDFLYIAKQYFINLKNSYSYSKMNIYIFNETKIKGTKNINILDVVPKNIDIDILKYDAIVFTSKNAINSINNINSNWKKIPSYVMSPQSAKLIKHLGGNLKFIGKEKSGNEFAYELIEKLEGKKVLYLRGAKVVSELISIFALNDIECDDYIVYETKSKILKSNINFPKNSTFVFSSPSIIKAFFENFEWLESYKAVCIGKTTAKYLPPNIKVYISNNTSIKSCVEKAIELNS